jgi:hypothetical protein
MADKTSKMTDGDNLEIPETTPVIGKMYSRIDFVADHRTPQGTLQLGRICVVARSGNAAENIVLPVLFNKQTGNRFASYGQTRDGEYRRNIQGITADTVEEFRAAQAMVQGWVKATVQLKFKAIAPVVEAVTATADAAAAATS